MASNNLAIGAAALLAAGADGGASTEGHRGETALSIATMSGERSMGFDGMVC